MLLETDRLNALEASRVVYQRRRDAGISANDSRTEAMAYLRRKTQWRAAYAAGAFDSYLVHWRENQ